jgi:hypothetical protein
MNTINFYNNIIDPLTNKLITINSLKGLNILKNYIMSYNQVAGAGSSKVNVARNILYRLNEEVLDKLKKKNFLLNILKKLRTDVYETKNVFGTNVNDRYKYLVLWLEEEDKQYIIDLVEKNINDPENTVDTITRIIYFESSLIDDEFGGFLDEYGKIGEGVTVEDVEEGYTEQLDLLEEWIEELKNEIMNLNNIDTTESQA